MKTALTSLLFIYVLCCLAVFLLQRKLLYFPQPAAAVAGVTEIQFDTRGAQLSGWIVNGQQPRALLYYGGNAEQVENNIQFFQQVLAGYSVYLVPYRGYGNNAGAPTEQALYSDALEIYEQIKNRHDSVSLMGRSLGSGVATYVAANRPVEKVILVTPFDSVENVAKGAYWMFPVSLLIKDKFQSYKRADKISALTYIFIAEKDRIIPRARTEQLIAQFGDQLANVVVIDGANHNDISQYPDYVAGIQQALE